MMGWAGGSGGLREGNPILEIQIQNLINVLMTKPILRNAISLVLQKYGVHTVSHEAAHNVTSRIILSSNSQQNQAEIFTAGFCFLLCHTLLFFSSESGKYGTWIHQSTSARELAFFNCPGTLVMVLRGTQAHWCKEVRQATGWNKKAWSQTSLEMRWLVQCNLDICVRAKGQECSVTSCFLNHKTQDLPKQQANHVFLLFPAHM